MTTIFNNQLATQNQSGIQTFHAPVYFGERQAHVGPNSLYSIEDDVLESLAFPQMLERRNNVEMAHPNTCDWIFSQQEYKNWLEQPCGLLWIKGKPGAGKSTLMAFLYKRLKEQTLCDQNIILEFFFSARGTELHRTPLGMLRSLLNQLCRQDPTVLSRVRKAYEENCAAFGSTKRTWQWQRHELEVLLQQVFVTSARQQSITIFVDALDEAGAEFASEIVAYLHRINELCASETVSGKICISCRHYPVVASGPGAEVCVEMHNGDDIAAFIRDSLRNAIDLLDKEYWESITETLITAANGVFQWAHLITPIIKGKIDDGGSPEEVRDWLRQVPQKLGGVYRYILENIIKDEHRSQSFRLFQWVCLAERPLSVTEMRYAMVVKDPATSLTKNQDEKAGKPVGSDELMKLRIRALSGGLVEVVSSEHGSGSVQVIHQSVNDYIIDHGLRLLAERYHQNTTSFSNQTPAVDSTNSASDSIRPQCHATLYRLCLGYFATAEPYIPNKYYNIEELLSYFPFLGYTTLHLFDHSEKASPTRLLNVDEEITLLQNNLSTWTSVYRRMEEKYKYTYADVIWKHPGLGATLLHAACIGGLTDVVNHLISKKDILHDKDDRGLTALHYAARFGREEIANTLLDAGSDIQAKCDSGFTPLLVATSCGHLPLVELLLSNKAEIGEANSSSETPLYISAKNGNTVIVHYFLREGAEVSAQGGYYGNALQAASLEGHKEIVQMLLAAGADVNAQGGKYANALQAASYKGYQELVQMLLAAGADVNAQGGEYANALQAASLEGYEEIVQMLLASGADFNAQGGYYGNALQAASFQGHQEIVQMLLAVGADVNAQGGYYGNALQAASTKNKEIVQMLLAAGADVNAQGGQYGNALQAASTKNKEIVQMLLASGADFNAQDGYYGNALQAASLYGHQEIVQMLLAAGADVNAQGGYYGNALQAASIKNKEIVQMLLAAGAEVNTQGGLYGNALQAASYHGYKEIVQMLLAAGAEVNAQGGQYGNALQAASYHGYKEIVQMLLAAGAEVNAQGGQYGNALQAASTENKEIVQMLLAAGAEVNTQGGQYGNTLQAASYYGHMEIVQMLLAAGAEVNAQGGRYGNALQAASYHGHKEIVQMLLAAGAEVNAQGGQYGNALQAASIKNKEIVQMLLAAGADVNAQGREYGNALQAASYHGHKEIVQMMLAAGAEVNAQGGQYGNALQAASIKNIEIVQMLLTAGAEVNTQGGLYGNALQAASFYGCKEIVQVLLAAGAEVNAQCGEYGNALQVASYKGYQEIVQMLLAAGADVNAQGGRYGTAFNAAVTKNNSQIIKLLFDVGADPSVTAKSGQTSVHFSTRNGNHKIIDRLKQYNIHLGQPDLFGRTPLHLAFYYGQIDTVIYLRQYIETISGLDGYGRTALDWASDHQEQSHLIEQYFPKFTPTPDKIRIETLKQSVQQISKDLFKSNQRFSSPGFSELGHCLVFLDHPDDACFAFTQQIRRFSYFGDAIIDASCAICGTVDFGTRYVCKTCAEIDICSPCMEYCYSAGDELKTCKNHDFLKVPYTSLIAKDAELTDTIPETVREWLRDLLRRVTETGSDEEFEQKEVSRYETTTTIDIKTKKENDTGTGIVLTTALLLAVPSLFLLFKVLRSRQGSP